MEPTGRRTFRACSGTFEGTIEHWELRVHPEDLPAMQARMAEAMAHGTSELTFAFRIVRPDGGHRWIEGAACFVYFPDSTPLCMVGVNMDTTERREAEQALRRLNADLEEFAFVVSHDLKEPLRMVHAYTQLLLRRKLPTDADAARCAHYIQTGVQRMEALIDDLLSYTRTMHTEDEPEPECRLQGSLERALMLLQEPIRTTQAIITYDSLPTVTADEGQLTQVFQNLLANSLKYHQRDRAPRIHIDAARDDAYWRIRIVDNGIGFDPRYAERIFGLFKRLHRDKYPGTGLGLAICKRIIERHGGTIWAESTAGVGSTFTFTLPTTSSSHHS